MTAQDEDPYLDLTTNQVQRDTETVFDTETENVFPEAVEPGPTPGTNGWTGQTSHPPVRQPTATSIWKHSSPTRSRCRTI